MGKESVFYPREMIERARRNAERWPWAGAVCRTVVEGARPWLRFTDEELWNMIYGHTLRRSWMVWSNGFCPSCREGVPMYQWQIDGHGRPWKVRCPHCGEEFPKNDFAAFHRSGLDRHGVFDSALADRSLLVNPEHPDPADPLHGFGVDDGDGYRDGGHTWWFAATYLIYGQWKQLIHSGIRCLASAYAVTGEGDYAHRAGILLDRVADLYPTFDFKEEGVVYEGPAMAGYVSTWHDACEETREMAIAYDQVRGAIAEDRVLVDFLAAKAARYELANPKACGEDVMRNIEEGILRHPLAHPDRIRTNYPRREICLVVLQTVLDWPAGRDRVIAMVDELVGPATAVDGVTGEKGLAGYSSYVIHGLAQFLEQYARIDPTFLPELLARHPNLSRTYRFHVDTWCFEQYYPQSGDTGAFGHRCEQYMGAPFSQEPGLLPSMFSLFWRLYELTSDPAYVQVLYRTNNRSTDDLPRDPFAEDPAGFQAKVSRVIAAAGEELALDSINLPAWHLAILRSGKGADRRAVWLDYDSGGRHGHRDGMNLGLYAKGLDLLPDYGYPPVQYGGWQGPRFNWYLSTAAHNTVVVDGRDQEHAAEVIGGRHTLWGNGPTFRAVRAAGENLYGIERYERTVVMVDTSAADSYVLDLFRVAGGRDHARFVQSHFSTLETHGLTLGPGEEYGFETQMRAFRGDPRPAPGWHADWRAEDRLGYLDPGTEVHLRYLDLTEEAEAWIAEGWIALHTGTYEDTWIPRVMIRRRAPIASSEELTSTFVGITEPYVGRPAITAARRLAVVEATGGTTATPVAVEITLATGQTDIVVAGDPGPAVEEGLPERPDLSLQVPARGVRLDGDLCVVRLDSSGKAERLALWRGRRVVVGDLEITLEAASEFVEVEMSDQGPRIVGGQGVLVRGH